MARYKHDYELLEREYVTSDVSIRELCRTHEITNFSTVAEQARLREWERKRGEYRTAVFQHEINTLAQRRAQKLAELQDEVIDVIRATVMRMAMNLQKDDYVVRPNDLALLIDKVQLLSGGATSREEVHEYSINADVPLELLREIQAAARAHGAGTETMGQSALPQLEGPRKVN